jgi:hypothetical protein
MGNQKQTMQRVSVKILREMTGRHFLYRIRQARQTTERLHRPRSQLNLSGAVASALAERKTMESEIFVSVNEQDQSLLSRKLF